MVAVAATLAATVSATEDSLRKQSPESRRNVWDLWWKEL